MQKLCLASIVLFAIHEQHSLFRVEGGCPTNEKNGKQNWRFAVFERKEKGKLITLSTSITSTQRRSYQVLNYWNGLRSRGLDSRPDCVYSVAFLTKTVH